MWRQRLSRQDLWLPAFVLGIMAASASFVMLFAVILDARDGSSRAAPLPTPTETSQATPSPANGGERLLRVWVDPAAGYTVPADLDLEVVAREEEADVAIGTRGAEGGAAFVARAFVPVAAMHTGIDGLTSEQLRALISLQVPDWSEVGGVAGTVVPAVVAADEEVIAGMLGATFAPAARRFTDYDELLAAMEPASGIIAIIPMDRVSVEFFAVALDGVDPVRADVDMAAWPLVERLGVRTLSDAGRDATGELVATLGWSRPQVTTVIAPGEFLISRCSLARIEATGDWAAALRGPTGDYLASADLTIAQYDGSIQDIADVLRCSQHTNLSSPPGVIENLVIAGVDGVSLATNHLADCGVLGTCGSRALLRTIELLEEAGITTYGAGANLEEALEPGIFERNGITFGVLGFEDVAAAYLEATDSAPGVAPLDDSYEDEIAEGFYYTPFFAPASMLSLERYTRTIGELKERVDVVIVQVNAGIEDTHDPSPRAVKALRAAVDAGADIIVGNGPHYPQAMEVRAGTFVAYPLGNFVYDQVHTPEHAQGYILEVTLWGSTVVNVKMVPYQIEDMYRPVIVEGDLRAKILADVFEASVRLQEQEPADN